MSTFAITPPTSATSFQDAAQLLRGLHVEAVLLPLLWQIGLIILAARLFAWLFRQLGQPSTVGEIAAGLIIGPSVLGQLAPGAFEAIFHPTLHGVPVALSDQLFRWIMTGFSQMGLIFLLFLIGMEFDFRHLKVSGKSAIAVSVTGVALPFALGWALAGAMYPYVGQGIDKAGFMLFMGTAMSITAIPILGRIMMEMGITRSKIGALTISAAAVDDALGWILLATVTALVTSRREGGSIDWIQTLLMLVGTVVFALAMIYLVRPLMRRWISRIMSTSTELNVNHLAGLIAIIFVCAIITNLIGIFAIFGAFQLGAIISEEHAFREAVNRRIKDFVTAFFLPIFFAYTGSRTNIGSLESSQLWIFCGLVSLAAIVGKFGGCGIAAWLTGSRPREAACIGIMMNTRALMELVVINVGKDLGVIPDSVYCMLVIMALVTTVMTTPIITRAMKGTELEPLIEESGFLRGQSQA
ncbi:MAG: hypothetical protein DWH91_05575 [Planctomycetota bacterium]|nr:MAG: hypothetical protein DWH91_05575 [Planctomycetota bacterium]